MATNFAEWLRSARNAKGLTQTQLAEIAELSTGQISRLENGEQGTKETTAVRLATALGCDPQDALSALTLSALQGAPESPQEKFLVVGEIVTIDGPGGVKVRVTEKLRKQILLEAEFGEASVEADEV
jgi:transcriptional regulator with XRE-family HTH domain